MKANSPKMKSTDVDHIPQKKIAFCDPVSFSQLDSNRIVLIKTEGFDQLIVRDFAVLMDEVDYRISQKIKKEYGQSFIYIKTFLFIQALAIQSEDQITAWFKRGYTVLKMTM